MVKVLNKEHVTAMITALKNAGFNILESAIGYEMRKKDGSAYKAVKCPWAAIRKHPDTYIVRHNDNLFI